MHRRQLKQAIAIFISSVLLWHSTLTGSTPEMDELSKTIHTEIRQAERLMFSGKNEEADALLCSVSKSLETLKAGNPAHTSIRTLQSKWDRLRTQVDKKLGNSSANVTSTSTSSNTAAPPVPAKSSPAGNSSSSGGYKKQMQDRALTKVVKDVDYELGRAIESLEPEQFGATPASAADKTKAALEYIDRAHAHLEKFINKYPDLENDKALTVTQSRIASKKADIEIWKKEQQAVEQKTRERDAAVAARQATSKTTMQADAAEIVALHETFYPAFEQIHGGTLVHSMQMPQIEQAIALLEKADALIPSFSNQLGRLADTYGTTSTDVYNTMHQSGYTLPHGEEHKMEALLNAMENVRNTRVASAQTLAEYANALLGAFSGKPTDHSIKRMGDAKAFLLAGQRFDPGNADIQAMLSNIDDQMAEAADKMASLIDSTEWKGNVSDFPGPGNVKALAKTAVKYFENDRDWGQKPGKDVSILDVCIRGPWKVAERDPFGRVIQWRLPIHVAVTDKELRNRKLARVYDLSILAQEGGPGNAPQKAPFEGYWVGDSWMMRLNKF